MLKHFWTFLLYSYIVPAEGKVIKMAKLVDKN